MVSCKIHQCPTPHHSLNGIVGDIMSVVIVFAPYSHPTCRLSQRPPLAVYRFLHLFSPASPSPSSPLTPLLSTRQTGKRTTRSAGGGASGSVCCCLGCMTPGAGALLPHTSADRSPVEAGTRRQNQRASERERETKRKPPLAKCLKIHMWLNRASKDSVLVSLCLTCLSL